MGNNYTVTIPNDELCNSADLTWKDLQTMDFTFDQSFRFQLAEDQVFNAEKIVRLMPGKRLVAFGTWQDKFVVAKLFFDPRHAKRHLEKEVTGLKILRENKIPTPALYYNGWNEDKRVYVLLFERIFESKSLEEIWQDKDTVDSLMPLMQAIMTELATQHVLGILQHDLHLKNFLLTRKRIYTIDAAQIEQLDPILPKKQSMENIALLLSQLGVGVEEIQKKLFNHYAKNRGWLLKPEDMVELFLMIKTCSDDRWQRFEKKIFRNSSNFAHIHDFHKLAMYDRHYAYPEFMDFLKHPETAFLHPTASILKSGRSSTVIKVILDQRTYVIKRYNLKNLWHRFRRCMRDTRAYTSWRLAQKLRFFGINTPKPIAFIENRWLGFRGQSYSVTEYVAGDQANQFFAQSNSEDEKISEMAKRIITLLQNLNKLSITHGDLKLSNIIIDRYQQPVLLDLDGMIEHVSLSGLRATWRKEVKRLLKNFDALPQVKQIFLMELEKIK